MKRTSLRWWAAASLVALALVGAGCGGGSGRKGAANAPSSQDASAILASAKTDANAQGPANLALHLRATVSGKPKNPQVAALLEKPIRLSLTGVADAAAKKNDLTFDAELGPLSVKGALRQDGDRGWLQLSGTWYELPPGALSSSSSNGLNVDPQKIRDAFGDPAKLLKDPTVVGGEDVGGVATDHVRGDLDLRALAQGIGRVASAAGTSSAPALSPERITEIGDQLDKYVDRAKVDVWIGKDDKLVHKLALAVAGTLDANAKASSGIDGFTADFDVTSTPTSTPSIAAPAGTRPFSELQQGLSGILRGLGSLGP